MQGGAQGEDQAIIIRGAAADCSLGGQDTRTANELVDALGALGQPLAEGDARAPVSAWLLLL